MKFSLATFTLCALSMSGTNAALFRGTARRELQNQGFTTEQVTVTSNTPTSGIPNCTPGQRVQFNNQSGEWECFNPNGAVVVGQGTNMQNIPEGVLDETPSTQDGATIIQPGGGTTVQEGPSSPSITTPTMTTATTTGSGMTGSGMPPVTVTIPPLTNGNPATPPTDTPPVNDPASVAANGITTPAITGTGVVTTGLSSCTSGQRAVFNTALQMWECNNNGGGANVVTVNGNAVGGNVVTVGTPNTSNNQAFQATTTSISSNASTDKSKKSKKSKKNDSNDNDVVGSSTINGGAMEVNVPVGAGCAAGQISVYMPEDGEWRCISPARSSNPDMDP